MLTGENGILSQAQSAKEKTNISEVKEKISLAMQSLLIQKYDGDKSEITAEELKNQLIAEGLTEFDVTGSSNLIVTMANNKSYVVKQNGEVLENNLSAVLEQGDYINYNSDSLSGGENWRVFYIDNNIVRIVTTNPTEIVHGINNGVTEESEELTRQFGEFLAQKRTEKVSVNVGRNEIVTKDLNYYSADLAKNYSLTITMDDIQKAIGIDYTIGETVSYEELKKMI